MNAVLIINNENVPANLLLISNHGSSILAWQGGLQNVLVLSSRYQLFLSSKVVKRRKKSVTSGWSKMRGRRVPGRHISTGPIRPEFMSFSCWTQEEYRSYLSLHLYVWQTQNDSQCIQAIHFISSSILWDYFVVEHHLIKLLWFIFSENMEFILILIFLKKN